MSYQHVRNVLERSRSRNAARVVLLVLADRANTDGQSYPSLDLLMREAMRANQKLTHLIAGRSISGTSQKDGVLTVTLDDGLTLTIKTAPSNKNEAVTGKIEKVQQQGTDLAFVLEGGKTLAVKLAEETSSVLMRDKTGGFAYSD